MKKTGFIILAIAVLGIIIYLTIAVLKITIGLIILGVAAVALIIIWNVIKHKWNKKVDNEA